MWQQYVNVVLGLWVIAVPFLGLTATQNGWALGISGFVIAALSFWDASEHSSMAHHGMRHA
jgi:hypothetical protein